MKSSEDTNFRVQIFAFIALTSSMKFDTEESRGRQAKLS